MPSFSVLHRRSLSPRDPQFADNPTGQAVTISSIPAATDTLLDTDPNHSGVVPGMPTPTITITSSSSSSATQASAPQTSTSTVSTPAIIGLTVGVFVILAVLLVIFMLVRNKRHRPYRTHGRGWSPVNEKSVGRQPKDQELPDQESNMKASVAEELYSIPVSPPAVSLRIQTQAPPQAAGDNEMSIPNPFITSPASSQASESSLISPTKTGTQVLVPMIISAGSFKSYTPQLTYMPASSAASSANALKDTSAVIEYPVNKFAKTGTSSTINYRQETTMRTPDHPQNQARLATSKSDQNLAKVETDSNHTALSKGDHKATRSRQLEAMKDLISALDAPASSPIAMQKSFLQIDTAAANGRSRLSMDEGIVTPSVTGGDSAGSSAMFEPKVMPLPSADMFRAGLGLKGHRER